MARSEKIALISLLPLVALLISRLPLESAKEAMPLLIMYGGISVAGATVTLLLDRKVNVALRLETALAGVVLGVLVGFILRDSNTIPEILREVIAASCGMFTDLIWRKWKSKVEKSDNINIGDGI